MAGAPNPLEVFFAGPGGTRRTQDQIASEREIANALISQGVDTSPVGHWLQGAARFANAGAGAFKNWRANEADEANRSAWGDSWGDLFDGGDPVASALAEPQTATGAIDLMATGGQDMNAYQNAIASIESAGSGDYAAVGPTHPELGRALGKYQVMEANIGPWSQQAIGRAVSPEEFLASPEIQDAVFNSQFGNYVNQYGPEGAAQAWFGGEGGVGQLDRQDSLGTSIGDYTDQFNASMGGQPQQMQTAQAGRPDMAALLGLMSDPNAEYASPMQQQIMASLFDQQMAPPPTPDYSFTQLDDGTLMRTDATSGNIEPMGQFAAEQVPDQTSAMQNYQYLIDQGMEPESAIERAFGGGQTINVGGNNDIGTIPSGYMVDRDEAGNVTGMRPIPGSEADQELQSAGDRQGVQAASDAEQAGTMLGVASQVRDIIENAHQPTTGTNSRPFALHSGTPAGRIRALVVPLQSGVALNAMMRLKAASAQGATGFGAMNQQELGLLINEIGALNPDTTEPDIFLDTLGRIENRYKRVIEDIQANVEPERIQELGLQPIIDAVAGNGPQQPNQSQPNPQVFNGTAQSGVQWRILD